jgi:flagellar basal body-associated protein FliL
MSLLVDLLSKTKTKELRKDIPPDLRKAVVQGAYRRKSRRKVIILSILVLIVFLAGFATIYCMEMFKTSLSTSIAAKKMSVAISYAYQTRGFLVIALANGLYPVQKSC